MAKSFSLEEALGGASSPAAKPSKKFSLDDALGVAPPKLADSATALQMPEGDDYGTSFLGAEDKPKPKVYTGSVFDTEPFDPQFNPAEAERLSRRDYAEKGAQPPRRVQSMRATPADQIERTAGQAVADTAIGLLQGAAGIPKGIAANINAGDNPVAEFYEKAIQAGERAKSPYLQSQKAEREALLKNVLSNQGELAQTRAAFTSMFSPAGADVVSQGAGSMLPVVGMSLLGLGQKAFVATNALANAGEAAQNTARELAQMSPQEWSKSEAYQELRASGLSHADSVRMLAPLMAMPAQLTGGVVGGISGATGLEKSLAGKGIKGGARERVARAGSELLGEEAETLAPSLAGNITQRLIDEQKSLTEGLGREAVETAFGATPGMALAATGRSTPDVQKEIDTRGLADRMARERGFLVPETRAERQTPTERPAPVQERVEPTFDEEAFIPAAPKATEDLTQQRAQEQADVLELESATSKPEVELETEVAAPAEETAQERLKRLSSKSIGMTNAFRDNIITNQEYDKFKSDLEAARQAVEQEAPDLSALSPAKREILEIADKLEAAGVKGFPRGMRLNARPEAREPDEKGMEFYRSKLRPYEEKQAAPESKPYGLPEFFSDNEKEVARITGLMKSGPLKTRVALSEANDSIQRLAGTIQAAGFDMDNLVKGQVPDGIMNIKSQIGNIAARANRLAAAAEAVQKKYKRADPARVKAGVVELMSDVEEADNLIAEDQNLPPLAEQMEGVAPPASPEVEELLTKQRLANEDIRILSNRTAGTSLMKVLEGSLLDSEMSELAGKARKIGKNPFISLVAKKGKRGSSMEDMVNSGKLDLFLPFAMRPGQPSYDNGEAAEYIREKLRTGEFYTDDIRNEIENIQRGIWDIEKQIEEELSLEDINREIQYAVDEQRALDQETAEPATEGAPEAPESSTGEEELLKAQTKEELKAKQDEIDRLSKENERLAKEAERRAKADEEAGDFVLTGSNRVADQAAARGQMELAPAEEPEGITVVSDTKGKDDYGNAVSNIELSNGNKYQLIRLNSTESMGLPGWHDANKFGPTDGGFLGNTKAEAIGELIERETQKKGGQTFRNINPPKAPSTDSAAFKKWFGDSKVVDENGEPLVVYHGTGSDISVFRPSEGGSLGEGIYFTDDADAASRFAERKEEDMNVLPVYIKAESILDADNITEDQLAAIKSAIPKNIEELVALGYPQDLAQDSKEFIERDLKKVLASRTFNPKSLWLAIEGGPTSVLESIYKAAGFDAITRMSDGLVGRKPFREYLVFRPEQIKSATGNIGTYDPENANILFDVRTSPVTGEPIKRAPSVTRRAKTLSRANSAGKISDMEFVMGVNAAIEAAEAAKMAKDRPERQRGADFIRQKLLEAKRRGDLSEEASDLAEWFILQNPALVDDLGISIRMKKAEGTAGQYIPFSRIMVLMKESANDQTPVHEILHHLERMMPADMQSAIRKEWTKQLTQAKQKAATPDERKFFELLFRHHYHENGSKNDFDKAVELIQDGKAPYEFYQYVNPSEFWAVNGSDIMQGRFDAVRGGVLQRMKNWLKELGQKFKSIFGMPSSAPLLRALDSLSKGDGQFVTKEMLGDAAGYAAIAGKNVLDRKPMANWTMPDSTNLDSFIYFMQNKQIDMKRAVEAIQQNVQTIDERFNPYMKETLFQGRAATQTKRFLQNELEPLFKEMGRLNVTMPELEEYLHNRHAQERNEQIASVNPGMPDEGSGIETADAQNYLANLSPDQEAKYKKLAGMVDAITAGTRQLLVDSGLESQETIDKWEETYDNYVPLNRDDIDYSSNHGMGVGQGYSVRGSASKRAVGSKRKVVDILANIAMQRERNIVRAEKNRVAMALYGLAIQNPNPDIFLAVNPDAKKDIPAATQELVNMGFLPSDINGLMKEPSTLEIDPQTGLAIERIHQMQRGADNVMGLRVNGENRYVFFNQNNERAKRMAMAIKNLDADKLGLIMSTTADITRFLAAMNTQYNPLFGAYNFLRDVSTAGLQLTDTPLAGKQKQVLNPKSVIGAMHGIYTDLRAERKGGAGTSQWSKLWEEFQQRGGQTGFRDQFSSTAKRGEALQRIVDPSSWADSGLGKVFTANGTLKVPMEAARKAAAPIFNWLSDYNEMMENAIRLSAYKTALDNGMSKDAAAVLAKELTVNFNRKGQIATQAGALYAFFNASVQGTTALIRTLSGPAGKAIIGGGLMLGAIQALLYSVAGFDEKEPKEFIREKNFVMPIWNGKEWNGKYIAIPLPLGYNVIPNTSRLITEAAIRYAQGKKVKPTETAFKVFESLLGAFNPIGNAGWSFQTAAPTVADPFVAIMENRDWTGKRIAREDFNPLNPTPGFTRYKESASTLSRSLAEFMNSISGGTKDAPGKISPTPDQIDYFISQVFGGVGREALKVERTIRSQFTGEELPPQAIPLAGRFYGDTKGSSAVSSAFYENLKQMNIHENTIKGMRKRKENVQEYFRENPEARMFDEAGRVEREVQALRKRRRELVEKSAPKESVRAIEARITARMKRFNDRVEQREAKRN